MPARRTDARAGSDPLRTLPSAHSPGAALGALLGVGLLSAGVATGRPALATAVLLVQLVLGSCWLAALQASLVTGAVVGLSALACDSLLLRSHRADAGSVAGVLGLAMLAAIGTQLVRRGRRDVTGALAATISGVVLVTAVALLLPAREFGSGEAVAVTALVAVAVGLVGARLVPGPAVLVRPAALVLAVAVGARLGATSEDLSEVAAIVSAATAAVVAVVLDLGIVRIAGGIDQPGQAVLRPVAALLPVAAAVPVMYAVAWALAS